MKHTKKRQSHDKLISMRLPHNHLLPKLKVYGGILSYLLVQT